jgi:hypothetical protein
VWREENDELRQRPVDVPGMEQIAEAIRYLWSIKGFLGHGKRQRPSS